MKNTWVQTSRAFCSDAFLSLLKWHFCSNFPPRLARCGLFEWLCSGALLDVRRNNENEFTILNTRLCVICRVYPENNDLAANVEFAAPKSAFVFAGEWIFTASAASVTWTPCLTNPLYGVFISLRLTNTAALKGNNPERDLGWPLWWQPLIKGIS